MLKSKPVTKTALCHTCNCLLIVFLFQPSVDAGDADQETVPGHLQGAEQAVQSS